MAENGAALRATVGTEGQPSGERTSTSVPTPTSISNGGAHPVASDPDAPIELRWRALVEAVRAARKMGAATALERAIPLRIGNGAVAVAFRHPNDALPLEDRETRAAVEAAFARTLGAKAALRIEQAPEAPQASLHDEKERARKEQKVQRLQAGRDHPAVRAAVELLGGEIEDVRDLGEE